MIQAYKINGIPLNEIPNWSISMLDGNASFIVNDVVLPNYEDISSITNWKLYGINLKDFNYVRERIREITTLIGFDNLTLNEKIISAEFFVVNKPQRDQVLTDEEQYLYWDVLTTQTLQSRYDRWKNAKKYISYRLSSIDSSDLAISTYILCDNYVNYNIITKVKDGVSGLFDYLTGEGDYIGGGYPQKSYWTQIDQDEMMNILQNGNY